MWLKQKGSVVVSGHWFTGKPDNMAGFFFHYNESYGKQSRAESDQDWIFIEWAKVE